MLQELWQDFRFGRRVLARKRSFTTIVVLTVALGIGATSAIFSVLYATVLAPLPFPESERLIFVRQINNQGRVGGFSPDTLDTWRKNSKTIDSATNALLGQVNFTVTGPQGAERIALEQVDPYTLDVLGTKPLLGRWF